MKQFYFVFIFFTVNVTLHAQLMVDWIGSIGGVDSDFGHSLRVDSNQNVFVAGQFRGNVSFDPNSDGFDFTAGQYGDVFLQKFDANGNFLWTKVFLGIDTNEAAIIAIDNDDNIYITSTFIGSIDLDPGMNEDIHTSVGSGANTYIVKLSNNGDYIWGKVFENVSTNQDIEPTEIAIDNTGNILLAGEFQTTVDFDFSSNSSNLTGMGRDGFLLKIDSDGNFVWVKQFAGNFANFYFSCLTFDSQNNIIAGGAFTGSSPTDFDPGENVFNMTTPNINNNDLFIVKLTADGDFIWAKKAEGYYSSNIIFADERVHSIVIDNNDDILFAGAFRNIINFDTNSMSFILDAGINGCDNCHGYLTGFIAKMDANGGMLWSKKIEGDNFAASLGNGRFYNNSILFDFNENQNLFFGYGFIGDLDYDINGVSNNYFGNINSWQLALFQVDPVNGNYISAHVIGNDFHTFLGKMIYKNDDLYIAGTYGQELFFDSNTSIIALDNPNSSAQQIYAVKYENVTTLSINEFDNSEIYLYPNPSKEKIQITSSQIIDKLIVVDINGRVLQTLEISTTDYSLDISNLSRGVYFVELQSGKSKSTKKFIKN